MKLHTRILLMIILGINFGSDSIKEKDNENNNKTFTEEELSLILKKETISKQVNIIRYIFTSILILLITFCVFKTWQLYDLRIGSVNINNYIQYEALLYIIFYLCALGINIFHISLKPNHKMFKISTILKDIVGVFFTFFLILNMQKTFSINHHILFSLFMFLSTLFVCLHDFYIYKELGRMNKRIQLIKSNKKYEYEEMKKNHKMDKFGSVGELLLLFFEVLMCIIFNLK